MALLFIPVSVCKALVDVDAVLAAAAEHKWIAPDGDGYRPGQSRPT